MGAVALQTFIDAVASYCSFATATTITEQDFSGAIPLSFIVYTLGCYFAIGVIFDLFTIGAIVTMTVLLGTKANAVLACVEDLAEWRAGLSVVQKAQTAMNTSKLVMALNSIANAMRVSRPQ